MTIPGNFDFFVTEPGSTNIDIGTDAGGDNPPLPAGFFGSKAGTPSDPFTQADIPLEGNPPVMNFEQFPQPLVIGWVDPHGNPVGPDSMHKVNQVLVPDNTPYDTVIRRLDPATFNGTVETQNVDIEIVALSLKSVDPILVTYGAESPVLWDVFITLDETATQPTGSIDLFSTTFTGSAVSGDVNNLDLPVAYKVIFREVAFPANEIIVPSGTGSGQLPPAQFVNPNPGTFSFPAGLVAEKTDILAVDGDGDNKTDPGDTLQYQVGIANHTGSDLTNVQFNDPLADPNLSLVGGSITITPIAFDDTYAASTGSTLTVTAAVSGILGNDVDPDGVSGAAGLDVTAAPVRDNTASTAPAGSLSVTLADGTFTYTPSGSATTGQKEVFTYNIVDAQTLNALVTGVITFNITAPPAPDAMNDSYSSIGNVGITVPAANGVLFNDTLNGGTITAFDATSANGGAVSVNTGDGSFTYTPAPGFEGMDTFTYTLTNGGGMDTATVTVTVNDVIWFIDNGAGGANAGTLQNPFQSIAAYNGSALPQSDDHIYLAETGTNYTSGLTLLNNQRLIGEGATGTLAGLLGITLPTHSNSLPALGAANNPVISITTTNALALASGNTVNGVDLVTTTGTGLSGTNFGSATISDMSVSTTGGTGVNLNTGSGSITLTSVSANGGSFGIQLTNTSSSFRITGDGSTAGSGGTIQNTTNAMRLANATDIELNFVRWLNITADGIVGSGIIDGADPGTDSFKVTNSVFRGIGTTGGVDDVFDFFSTNQTAGTFNISGDVTFTGNTFDESSGGARNAWAGTAINIQNQTNVTMNLLVDGNSFANSRLNADDAVKLLVGEGSTNSVTVQDNSAIDVRGNLLSLTTEENATSADVNVLRNEIRRLVTTTDTIGGGVSLNATSQSRITFDIVDNRPDAAHANPNNGFYNLFGDPITVSINGTTGLTNVTSNEGRVNNNRIEDAVARSIVLFNDGDGAPMASTVQVDGNTVLGGGNGVDLVWRESPDVTAGVAANNRTWNLTISNNTLGTGGNPLNDDGIDGLDLNNDQTGIFPDPNGVFLFLIEGNSIVTNSGSAVKIDIEESGTGEITVRNNPLLQSTSTTSLEHALEIKADQTTSINATIFGNTLSSAGTNLNIELDRDDTTSTLNVEQASSAAVTAANNGATVNISDEPITFGTATPMIPVLPSNLLMAVPAGTDEGGRLKDEASGDQTVADSTSSFDNSSFNLHPSSLAPIVAAAKVRWTATGLDAAQQAALDAVTVNVADMPSWYLAKATGPQIAIDSNAAGYGWFIDATPFDDSEFESRTDGQSVPLRMDLLTTVLHEMGHVLGLDHSAAAGDVMAASLFAGVRRVPTVGQAEEAVPLSVGPTEFMVGPVALGTLPAGKAVQISYQALISATPSATMVSNQGTVTADGPITALTDDPSTTAANDPTVTQLDAQPPAFSKAFAPDVIGSGGISTLTVTIDNTGGSQAATALDFTDNLPAAITVATPANAATTCTGGALTATSGTSVITYTGGSVAAGASCTVQVDVTSSTVGTHVNTSGDLTSSLGNSGTASDSLIVEPPPTFAKLFAPDTIISGGASTITFTIDNSASSLAVSSLDFTDNLPAGVVVAAAPAASTTCTGGTLTAAAGTSVISYSGGTVAVVATCTVQVDVTSSVAGAHVNTTGDLTSSSGNSGTASDTLNVIGLDFGDAPDAPGGLATGNPYPTLLEHNGARHALVGAFLGASIDDEADGQPNGTATGDDTDGNDDEDGVTFTSPLVPGTMATVDITTSGAGLLNAWIDFNDNGSWADPGEQIFTDFSLGAGLNAGLTFPVPFVAPTAQTFARFRFDQGGGLSYDGPASDGEVEDYEVAVSGCSTSVTNVSDSGAGSLRNAISCANVTPGVDTIDFNIPGAGVHTIAPLTNLPAITEQATVDATTQMGYAGTPLIQIDGHPNLGLGGIGLEVGSNADGTIIRGFNIIGMFDKGIFVSRADNVKVEANFIGTTPDGTVADPMGGNNVGILILNGAGNTVGGNTAAQRNLIGTNFLGVSITGPNSTGNTVAGNFIGTDITGTVSIFNTTSGIEIAAAPGNTIGGTTPADGNVISTNENGIDIRGGQASGNMVQNNLIGTDLMGTAALGNTENGIYIRNGASGTTVDGNVISGNLRDGVHIASANVNTVTYNAIGTDANGMSTMLANRRDGVEIRGTSLNNVIGGTTMADGNLISGNSHYGVKLTADTNQVQGNRIGTNLAGTAAIGNGRAGVLINGASGNTIGGANAGGVPPGNQISGNQSGSGDGVLIIGNSSNNLVLGNLIGTDAAGNSGVPNVTGVRITASGIGNRVGGDSTAGEGNLISGNTNNGVIIRNAGGVNVFGNRIGTNAAGTAAVGNSEDGIEVFLSTNVNIGGTGQGQANLISGNAVAGVEILSGSATVRANRIGTNLAGNGAIANGTGVVIGGVGSTIGGDSTGGEGNQISGNTEAGVQILNNGATGNMIRGNLLGTDATGGGSLANKYGVSIANAPSNTVGGANVGDGNTISGNTLHGVFLQGAGTTGNQVQGNQIGTNLAGMAALPNQASGVLIDGAPANTIGGAAPGAGNVISGNTLDGVKIDGGGATGNQILGNAIGTDAAGTLTLPNRNGVLVSSSASGNAVGDGTAAGSNTIANNAARGVWINGNAGTGNTVTNNSIHDNAGLGIALAGTGVLANDAGDPDAGANNLQNSPVIQSIVLNGMNLEITYLVDSTAANSDYTGSGLKIEFFLADANNQEGETFVVDDDYTTPQTPAVVAIPGGGIFGQNIVATATDASGNTSEFSAPFTAPSPLLAAGGEASREPRVEGQVLSIGELAPVFDAAVARLVAAGLDRSLFSTIDVSIADLPGATLALASGNSVTIDVNAAGHGWFVDTTPFDDSEFVSGSLPSALDAPLQMDLLTVVMHELGHVAGLDDLSDPAAEDDVMYTWLEAGIRKASLEASLADDVFAEF